MKTPAVLKLPRPPMIRAECPETNPLLTYLWRFNVALGKIAWCIFHDLRYGYCLFPDKTLDCGEMKYNGEEFTMNICGTNYRGGCVVTQRTTSLYSKTNPQLQVVDDTIHYVWVELDNDLKTQIWTATMETNGSAFSATKRTTGSLIHSAPQLQVVGDTIYYVYTYNKNLWTATMGTDGSNWLATERRDGAGTIITPQLEVVGTKIYYIWSELISGQGYRLFTGNMDTNGSNWSATQQTSASGFHNDSSPQLHVDGSTIHYVFSSNLDGTANIYTATSDLDGSNWSATQRTTATGNESQARPQLQIVSNTIYYVWEGKYDGDIYYHPWTATMETDGSGWVAAMHADIAIGINQKVVSGDSKIYYVYADETTGEYGVYTAVMNTDGTGWAVLQKTDKTDDLQTPQLDVSGDFIHYIWNEYATYRQLWIMVCPKC